MNRRWKIFLFAAILIGILLRVTFVHDMEYKEDEEYNFTQSQAIGRTVPWPWYGIPSGVYLPNPGMSIWVFAGLARVSGAATPTELATAVQLFSVLGMLLILPFAIYFVRTEKEKKLWLWALALALVNPFAVLYERKLWPEPILPFFCMLTLMGWWRRERWWGAFCWGLIGAWLGQIHMSGFFLAGAFFLWTALFGRALGKTRWSGWWAGTLLGALPLIPWFAVLLAHPMEPGQRVGGGFEAAIQLKYWVFWLTDALGLHLGNPLGLLRGESGLAQIFDFARYPLWNGHATFLIGFAHVVILGTALVVYGNALVRGASRLGTREFWLGTGSSTAFLQNAALLGCGLLLTLTTVNIRRYYMVITFPLEMIFLVRLCQILEPRRACTAALAVIWAAQALISAGFVGYIHVNEGSTQGDYGKAYHVIMKERGRGP